MWVLISGITLSRSYCQQILFTSATAEESLNFAFHNLYIRFEQAVKNKEFKIYPYGFNEIRYSDSCHGLVGTEAVETKEGILFQNDALTESEIIFHAVLPKGDQTDAYLTDIIRWNVSIARGSEMIHFAIMDPDVFCHFSDSADRRIFSQVLNHIKLYDKKLYNKYTPLNRLSIRQYAEYIPFALNIRLRNLALHQTIPVYRQAISRYENNPEKYKVAGDSLEMIWTQILETYHHCADTTQTLSGFGISNAELDKNTCLLPIIGFHACQNQRAPLYGGYIPWQAVLPEISSAEYYALGYFLKPKRKLTLH